MITLAVDTSSAYVSAAVVRDGTVLASSGRMAEQQQGETLAPLIAEVLAAAAVAPEQIVVGVGPGPFTGLRVGMVTAAVLARVWRVPVIGVCSLDALAWRASEDEVGTEFIAATDARRSEVYWSRYTAAGIRLEGPDVGRADSLPHGAVVVGAGAERYRELLLEAGSTVRAPLYCEAAHLVLALHHGVAEALAATPLYLRRPDATPPGPRKPVRS